MLTDDVREDTEIYSDSKLLRDVFDSIVKETLWCWIYCHYWTNFYVQ